MNGEDDLDHAVLVVGFESNKDGDYYVLKNSLGESWGESLSNILMYFFFYFFKYFPN